MGVLDDRDMLARFAELRRMEKSGTIDEAGRSELQKIRNILHLGNW